MHTLDGHVAIVTGGARGIGASIAQVLAEHGADIAILDWNLDDVQTVIEMAQAQGAMFSNKAVFGALLCPLSLVWRYESNECDIHVVSSRSGSSL